MKNRFVFPLLITLLISLLFSPNAFSEETVVRVAPRPLLTGWQDPSVVDIVIENGQNVAGYQVLLQYDSALLEYQKIERGDYLPKGAFFGEPQIVDDIDPIDDSLKAVRFASVSFTSESNGYGVLATLTFNNKKSSGSDLTLLDDTVLSNKAGELSFPRLENSKTYPMVVRDLVIESVQARLINTEAARQNYSKGEAFELSATVRNSGNVESSKKYLIFYSHAATDIEKGAVLKEVGIEPVPPHRAVEITLPNAVTAPDVYGTYYYTVCLGNKCSKIEINVKELPDLVIKSVRADPVNVNPGQTFELSATVKNDGAAIASATLRFYGPAVVLSGPAIGGPPPPDFRNTALGEPVDIVSLPSQETSKSTITVTAPSRTATYYYTASIDSVGGEVDADKNSSHIATITVIKDDHGNTLVDATPLPLNESLPGVIETTNDVDYFKMEVSSRGELTLYTTGNLGTFGQLERATGDKTRNNDSGSGLNFRIHHDVMPQTYYIRVTGYGNSTGNYTIHASFTPKGEELPGLNVFRHVEPTLGGLTLENQFTDIAVTENATYFVWEPDVPKVRPGRTTIPYKSTITLDISPHDDNDAPAAGIKALDELGKRGKLPSEYPYFIMPLGEIPMEEWNEAGDLFTWRKVLRSATIELIKEGIKWIVEQGVDKSVDAIEKLDKKWGKIVKIAIWGSKAFYSIFVDARDLVARENVEKDLILEALRDPSVVIEDYEVFGIRDSNNLDNRTPRYLVMIPKALEELKIRMTTNYFAPEVDVDGKVVHITVSILKNQSLLNKGELDLFWDPDEQHIRLHLPDGALAPDNTPVGSSLKTLFEYWTENDNNWYLWGGQYNSSGAQQLNSHNKKYIQDKLKQFLILWALLGTRIHEEALNDFAWEKSDSFAHPLLKLKLPSPLRIPPSPLGGDYPLQFQSAAAAAPHARTMLLADYPPFQELSPEVQALLMNNFGETAPQRVNEMESETLPQETALLPNYPNPFNPETWIPYQLSEPADVTLTIYDIHGHIVRDLDLGHQRAGTYHSRNRAAYWDGRNAQGEPVASGIYFYTLKAGEFTATRKMLIRK